MNETPGGRRALGVDVGSVRVGIAISDPDRTVATPVETLSASEVGASGRTRPGDPGGDERAWAADLADRLVALAAERDAGVVVIGLPRGLSGRDTASTRSARAVAAAVEEAGLAVELWDERLSTAEAERTMRAQGSGRRERRTVRDRVAAVLILQGWLDANRT
ncbi:Holliday junction resolvase RuvX [Egibacter rhizosphaerae]|uniref:Putative pre-16S rRNA nuclease n=1 Tax=Egibacter rhizosphaerae TaxID=1670831 RepID=A0A411YJW9_9ACTN|nr:Holliday junction resolvase RuvX [Egibacter rhizosphaerae]QBI21498.1 Holliday junction resolvase RuvX [Egibacter rhizosphaerae]